MKPKKRCETCECNKPWKPKEDDTYWYVDDDMTVFETTFIEEYDTDMGRVESNNYFRTKEEAESAAKKVKALLLSLKK